MTRVLGFAGSLREDSYNRALLRAARELGAAEGIEVEIFEIGGIPPYNQDDEGAMPAVVRDFKSRIEQADAVLIATPEYNYSVSGVLKNAIDWASRPGKRCASNCSPWLGGRNGCTRIDAPLQETLAGVGAAARLLRCARDVRCHGQS